MSVSKAKSLLPGSLLGRSLAILLIPLVALQLIVGLVFFQRHYHRVTEQMTASVARSLDYVLYEIDGVRDPAQASELLDRLDGPLKLTMTLTPGEQLASEIEFDFWDFTGRTVASTFRSMLAEPIAINLSRDENVADIVLQSRHGTVSSSIPRTRLSVSNPHQLLVLMVLASLLLAATAVLFLRNQVKPIRRLAEASEAFGKGRTHKFHPSGAEEVRRAGHAFLAMRSRIERHMEQRTQMLSGVSHDLRTPLTRMKLSLAMMDDDEDTRLLLAEVDEMQRMLSEFLAFTRGDSMENSTPADPFQIAADLVEKARRTGSKIGLVTENTSPEDDVVSMRPVALMRAVQNLVGNALRYGSEARLTVRLSRRFLTYVVEDNGPGIPVAQRATAVQPFTRLDPSRNQNQGGNVGLGLSITADIARSHGGALELSESTDLGGLQAELRIPR